MESLGAIEEGSVLVVHVLRQGHSGVVSKWSRYTPRLFRELDYQHSSFIVFVRLAVKNGCGELG